MMFYLKGVVLSVFLLALPWQASGFASRVDESHPFGVIFDDTGVELKNGTANVEFRFTVPKKFYLYKDAFSVTMDTPGISATLELPAAERKFDPFQAEEVDIFHDEVVVNVMIKVPQNHDVSQPLVGQIAYQGCSDKLCYRLMQQPFSFTVLSSTAATSDDGSWNVLDAARWQQLLGEKDFSRILQNGLLITLALCFLAGFLTGFTPCVWPVIPLTLAFMGFAQARGLGERVLRFLPFAGGMVMVNTALSLIPLALGRQLGSIYQSPVFLAFLVLFFLLLALWMLGVLNVALPASFLTRVQRYQLAGWVRSNLYAGATLGMLAMPCVGPVQATLLVYVAMSADWLRGIMSMLSYSLGLSVVFLIFSMISQGVTTRFAAATVWVKRFFGMMLILVALFYAHTLYGVVRSGAYTAPQGIFLADFNAAKKLAMQEGKPLMIDFFADWCVPCHEWSDKVFSRQEVSAILRQDFVAVQINCTTNTDACEKVVRKYDVIGWPTLVFIGPDGREIPDSRIVGYVMKPADFVRYLHDMKQGSP